MYKAVLPIEEIPDCCWGCNFRTESDECLAMDVTSIEVNALEDKPEWCPLVPMPEHKKPLNKKGYRSGYIEGWNDAIDAIDPG